MSTHPTETAPQPSPQPPRGDGPRVSRDEVRDLARLRRSRDDRKIGGVAGGIARHLDIDPIIPRVLLVVLVFFGGAGVLLYAALWLVVPVEGTDEATIRLDDRSRAVALVIVGAIGGLALLGDTLGGWGFPWPVVLGGVVVLVVMLARGGEPRVHPLLREGGTAAAAPAPRPSRRRGPVLFWYAVAAIALGCGVLGIVDTAGADVRGSAYPALALATCAALLLLGAFWGRAGGLIALGLVAAVATAGATAAGEADAGEVRATPTSAAAVSDRYVLDFGVIDLDLTRVVDPENLDGQTVEVELRFAGRIEVTVPDDVDVVVHSDIEEGDVEVFGDVVADGPQTTSADGGPDAPRLTLDVSTEFGEIVVTRQDANR
ncbi:PspC domain-containing protein [Nocardioides rubriscoriae]|uniref:PspC domain-containing protein n=1 Tax=Nocardioides rubriscoriae TaxID=642762 RepID=UPI0014784546|nr:PspC domain-containing protein [Nocardioides rubriscoriae]